MNPAALFLIIVAVGFGVGAFIVYAFTGGGLNVLWLLGVFSVIGALAVQTFWPTTIREVSPSPEAHALSRLDRLDGLDTRKADR